MDMKVIFDYSSNTGLCLHQQKYLYRRKSFRFNSNTKAVLTEDNLHSNLCRTVYIENMIKHDGQQFNLYYFPQIHIANDKWSALG